MGRHKFDYARVEKFEGDLVGLKAAEIDYLRGLETTIKALDVKVEENFRAIKPHIERLAVLKDGNNRPGSYHETSANREDLAVHRSVLIAPTTYCDIPGGQVVRIAVNEDGVDPGDMTRYRLDMYDYLVFFATGDITKKVTSYRSSSPLREGWVMEQNSGPYIHIQDSNQVRLYEGASYYLPHVMRLSSATHPLEAFDLIDHIGTMAPHLVDVLKSIDADNHKADILLPREY